MLTTYVSLVAFSAVLMTVGLAVPAVALATIAAGIVLRWELLFMLRAVASIRAPRVSAPDIDRVKG